MESMPIVGLILAFIIATAGVLGACLFYAMLHTWAWAVFGFLAGAFVCVMGLLWMIKVLGGGV